MSDIGKQTMLKINVPKQIKWRKIPTDTKIISQMNDFYIFCYALFFYMLVQLVLTIMCSHFILLIEPNYY